MTYQEFRRAVERDPNVRREVFGYQHNQGHYTNDQFQFEQDFNSNAAGLEPMFTDFYADNIRRAERIARRAERIDRTNRANLGNLANQGDGLLGDVWDNGYFRASLFVFGIGLSMMGATYFGYENDENLFKKTFDISGPGGAIVGLVGMGISGFSSYLSGR